jgi:hypothetical protein
MDSVQIKEELDDLASGAGRVLILLFILYFLPSGMPEL